MSMPGDTIRYIFSVEGGSKGRQDYMVCNETSACHFTPRSLGLLSGIYLLLMALASGVAVPGGLFMPSIMVRPCLSSAPKLCLSFVLDLCLLFAPNLCLSFAQSLCLLFAPNLFQSFHDDQDFAFWFCISGSPTSLALCLCLSQQLGLCLLVLHQAASNP